LVEAVTARALNLRDGQIVQATVQSRADEMVLMLRGRQVGIARVPGWEVGQRLSFRTQANPDGSIALVLINGKASAYSNPGLPTMIEAQARPLSNQPSPNPNARNDNAQERNPSSLSAPATPPSHAVVAAGCGRCGQAPCRGL
jgi:hypothetical protein